MMKGRVGQTTYYISKGQQVARQSRNDSNYGDTARRTELQQNRRVLWANLVSFYKVSARWMQKAFETKRPGQTDYNKFMQVNIGNSRISLTKSEAVAGACVVDGYVVTQGSLPSVSVIPTGSVWRTNLMLGDLQIGATTTIGEFTQSLINNNANVREGMQLSFVSYMQSRDALGTPRVLCRCYECTLISSSTAILYDYLPAFCAQSVNNSLGTSTDIAEGGFTYILSELVNGALKVSTQQLTTLNNSMIEYYTSADQVSQAVESYGLDTEVILSPTGTIAQDPEPVPAYLNNITFNEDGVYKVITPGGYFGQANRIAGKEVDFIITGKGSRTVQQVQLGYGTSSVYTGTIVTQLSVGATATFASISEQSLSVITSARAVLSDGTIVDAQFATE